MCKSLGCNFLPSASCSTQFVEFWRDFTVVRCPNGCLSSPGSVSGTDFYKFNSVVCRVFDQKRLKIQLFEVVLARGVKF